MTALSSPSRLDSADSGRDRVRTRGNPCRRRSQTRPSRRGRACKPTRLGTYRDDHGRLRELVALNGHAGSVLLVDRDAATLCDRLLLAHLAHDEPGINVELVCRDYLTRPERPRCRRLLPTDLSTCPAGERPSPGLPRGRRPRDTRSVNVHGWVHRLDCGHGGNGRPELRWRRSHSSRSPLGWEPVSLRELVGRLESYEPVRTITAAAIADHRGDRTVSVRQLQGEYRWLCKSPVILNRALREAVLQATTSGRLTMSEIALRCGIVKRDRRGRRSGETSWLARRVGLMPEGGAAHVTPWIHSDVLALIAREGLRMSPHEVEVP